MNVAAWLVAAAILFSPWPLGSWYTGPRTLIYLLLTFAAYLLVRPHVMANAANPCQIRTALLHWPDAWAGLPLVMALSISWSVAPSDSYEQGLFWGAAFTLYLCVSRLLDQRSAGRLTWALTLLGGALALYTLYQYWCASASFPAVRMSGPFTYPNSYAAYLLALTFVPLGLASTYQAKRNVLALVAAAALVASFLYTGSRGALLTAPIAAGVFLWLAPHRRHAARSLAAAAIGGTAIFVALLFLQPAGRGLPVSAHAWGLWTAGERVVTTVGSPSWTGRLEFWCSGLRAFLTSPWIGLGAGSYHQVATAFQLTPELFANRLHNDYLQFLAELGLLGGGAVLAAVAGTVRGMYRLGFRRRAAVASDTASAAAGVTAILVHSAVDLDLQFPAVVLLLFTLLGIMVRASAPEAAAYRIPIPARPGAYLRRALPVALPLALLVAVLLGVRPYGALVARQRAQDALEEGNLVLARQRAEIAQWVLPGHPRTAMLLAHILRQMSDHEHDTQDHSYWLARALDTAIRGAHDNPYDPYLRDLVGCLYLHAGNTPAALVHLEQAVALYRWEPQIRLHLALAYEAAGQKRRAVEELAFLLSHRTQFQRTVAASPETLENVFREAARILVSLTVPPAGQRP